MRVCNGGGAGREQETLRRKVRMSVKSHAAMALAKTTCPTWSRHSSRSRRMTRIDSWAGQGTINYDKLKELCLYNEPANDSKSPDYRGGRVHSHVYFMEEYTSIVNPRTTPHQHQNNARKIHTCNDYGSENLFDVSMALINIHGRDKRQQEIVDLNSRLKAMLGIMKKQPVQRSSSEVKELAHHFLNFPGLLPRMEMEVLVGMASRAKMEQITKHTIGQSLPGSGGVYIILQGSVEKLTKDSTTADITSEMLEAGQFFGELTPTKQHPTVKLSYPSYSAKGLCTLIRLTTFNYERVIENWESTSFNEKSELIKSCLLLQSVSPSVITKLAEAVTWETIEPNQTVLAEGEEISRVAFVQSGSCIAYARVPKAPRFTQVTVGHLQRRDCIGEGMLRGNDHQPYTIVSSSRLRVGWVTSTTLRVNEVEKHILSDKEFTLKLLSSEEIRRKYAHVLMDKQWNKIKKDIVQGVVMERGIRRGHSKWRHSRSHSADRVRTTQLYPTT